MRGGGLEVECTGAGFPAQRAGPAEAAAASEASQRSEDNSAR